jgi:hypothetical protein
MSGFNIIIWGQFGASTCYSKLNKNQEHNESTRLDHEKTMSGLNKY